MLEKTIFIDDVDYVVTYDVILYNDGDWLTPNTPPEVEINEIMIDGFNIKSHLKPEIKDEIVDKIHAYQIYE